MENNLLYKDDHDNEQAPITLKEREIEVINTQSKRIRITAEYLNTCKIEASNCE